MISVIIPIYNGQKWLREAVDSVCKQTLLPDELILVDDGSRSNPFTVLEGLHTPFQLMRVRQENAGQSAARNHGARLATGEYLAFLDQDDRWYPEHLERLLPMMKEGVGWAYHNVDLMNEKGRIIQKRRLDHRGGEHPKKTLEGLLAYDLHVLPSASLVLAKAFQNVGGFDVELSGFEDDDLFVRIQEAGWQNKYLPESLSAWRIHRGSSGFSSRMAQSRDHYEAKLLGKYPEQASIIKPRFAAGRVNEKLRRSRIVQFILPFRHAIPKPVRKIGRMAIRALV